MVIYCILTGLLVYYIALWLWYRHADNRRSEKGTNDKTVPESQADGYTLIGESRYKGGLIGTVQDKSGQGFQGTFFLPFFASDFKIESKIERNIPIRKE